MKLLGAAFIIIVLLFSCQSREQSIVIPQSSVDITMRIYEISSNTPLSQESILKLKAFFQKNDSLAEVDLKRGKALDKIAQCYYPSVNTIAALLTPLERNDYMFNQKNNRPHQPYISELRTVVKYRKEMNLSNTQIENLLSYSEEVEQCFGNQGYKHSNMEKQYLIDVLSQAQYKAFFIIKKTEHAEATALQQWKQIRAQNLCLKMNDSLDIIKQLYEFEREKSGILEYMSSIDDHEGYDKERSRLNAHKPLLLLRLETNESFSHNKLLDIICKREFSQLTEKQIELLLKEYLCIMRAEHRAKYEDVFPNEEQKFDRGKLEGKCLMNIISRQQLDAYFEFISQKRVGEQAQKYWNDLKNYDFMTGKDSMQVVLELTNYELRLAVANQWITLDNSRKHLFAREDVINGKPEVLKKKEEWDKKKKDNKIVRF